MGLLPKILHELEMLFHGIEFDYSHIESIELDGNTVVFTTSRPGLLIGAKGRTIDKVVKVLKDNVDSELTTMIVEFNLFAR